MELFLQILSIVAPFVTGYLGYVLALRKLPGEDRKMNVDAAAVASKALIDLINAMTAERGTFTKRIDAMEAEQETHRIARNAEIDDLKATYWTQGSYALTTPKKKSASTNLKAWLSNKVNT
jgi:hypothetical protein